VEPSLDPTITRSAGATEPDSVCVASDADGSTDTLSECINSESGESGTPREDDPCTLLGADAQDVASLCYQYAVTVCNGPLERWPGLRESGSPDEWDDKQLKDIRCLGETVAVLQSYWQCLPAADHDAICEKVLNYPDGKHVGFTRETKNLCDNKPR
jgi:hypothetical protein